MTQSLSDSDAAQPIGAGLAIAGNARARFKDLALTEEAHAALVQKALQDCPKIADRFRAVFSFVQW